MLENKTKRTVKDTMFRAVFTEPIYFVDLYRASSGEEIRPEDITPFSLSSDSVTRGISNDVSHLLLDERILHLTEHQSLPNPNIVIREYLYSAELLRLYTTQRNIDLSGENKIILPEPELYVAYMGKRKYPKEHLEYRTAKGHLHIKLSLVDINFDSLKEQDPKDYLAGYAYFHKQMAIKYEEILFKQNISKQAANTEAFEFAREQCMVKGYFLDFVRKEDFVMVYAPIYDRDEELRAEGRYEERLKAITIMLKKGISIKDIADGFEVPLSTVEDLQKELAF